MAVICHPEATCFSSPKDLGAPRDSPAFLAGDQNARLERFPIHEHSTKGGENSEKFG
jgi:hypothetical protein